MKEENKDKNVPKINSLSFEEYKEIYDNSWTNFQRIAIHLLKEEMKSKRTVVYSPPLNEKHL